MAVAKRPWVDQEACISCGICVNNLPAVFRFADNGKSECYDPHGAPEEQIERDAINACPVSCIYWKE